MTQEFPATPQRYHQNSSTSPNTVALLRDGSLPVSQEFLYDPRNSFHGSVNDSELDIFILMKIMFKYKFLILACLVLGAIAGSLFGLQKVPLYKSAVTIEVQKEETQIVNGSGVEPATVADAEFMQTQYTLLKSRSLAERVVLLLSLENNEAFASQKSERNDRIQQAANILIQNLHVEPVGRSRVIKVSYISEFPNIAAIIPNTIVDNYIESTLERKLNTTAYARKFLQERLAQAKVNLEETERSLVQYADENDILEINQSGSGSSLTGSNLIHLTQEYSAIQSERIKLEQAFRELQTGNATNQTIESPDLARLRANRSNLNAEYTELLGTFKPAYPQMKKLAARIEAINLEITEEKKAILEASNGAYRSAITRENILKDKIEASKIELRNLRNRRVNYTILQRELDTARSQYDALLQRLKEVSIASGVGSSQISIVDRAIQPKFPFSPNIPFILTLAAFLGLTLGLGLSCLLQILDDTIKTPDDVKTKLKLPAIGVIPTVKTKGEPQDLIIKELSDPRSSISEAYFSTRTALEFATEFGAPNSLLLTSTQPAEGKSSTSLALAVSFAKIGRRVLIIDADLRKPSFVADTDKSHGLSGLLTTTRKVKDNIIYSETYDLHLLPSGVIPPNPAQLLSGPRLKAVIAEAEDLFDIVIVDSPPILNFTDGPVLGRACKATVIVCKSGSIRTAAGQKTIERLRDNNVNIIGAILTHFDAKKTGYDYNYYYYAYGEGASEYGIDKNKSLDANGRTIRLFQNDARD